MFEDVEHRSQSDSVVGGLARNVTDVDHIAADAQFSFHIVVEANPSALRLGRQDKQRRL